MLAGMFQLGLNTTYVNVSLNTGVRLYSFPTTTRIAMTRRPPSRSSI